MSSPFAGLRPPPAPPELRGRVLEACAETLAAEAPAGLLDRLWESRPARLAWLAGVVVLLAANLAVSLHPAGAGTRNPVAWPRHPAAGEEVVPMDCWWHPSCQPTWIDAGLATGRPRLDLD